MPDALSPDELAALRVTYRQGTLSEEDLATDPSTQFAAWLQEAVDARIPEPNAMVLATADAAGHPSARTVLLKAQDQRGFVFFTGYTSRKGVELADNPWASLVFPWIALERQVVVVGAVERVSRAETQEYFASRPWASRVGAWASEQSSVVASRTELDERLAAAADRFPEGSDVPVPDRWGGLRVIPTTVEFWQGRPSRLHDRLRYHRVTDGWNVERLSP